MREQSAVPDELLLDDETHPIPFVRNIDIMARNKKIDSVVMVVVIASPLQADERSQYRFLIKVENYLDYVNGADFAAEFGSPAAGRILIQVSLHDDSDPISEVNFNRMVPWAAANNATLMLVEKPLN